MILVDANLLIYARSSSFRQHDAACKWFDELLSSQQRIGLPWPSILAFLRILSHPRIVERPEPLTDLWAQVESWVEVPGVWIPTPTERHAACFRRLLSHVTHPNLVPDAHLAALCLEYGLTLYTTDGDFARFPSVSWKNPLRE